MEGEFPFVVDAEVTEPAQRTGIPASVSVVTVVNKRYLYLILTVALVPTIAAMCRQVHEPGCEPPREQWRP